MVKLAVVGLSLMLFSMSTAQEIQLEWSFFHPKKKQWMDLGKKGSVQEALIASGEMPDPFYGTNELKFAWIEDHDWEFKALFSVDSAMLSKEYVELIFPSLDTYGTIFLNDSLIGTSENAFIPHSFQVKKHIKAGMNELHIKIVPPVRFHANRWNAERYHLPAPNDVHDTAIAPYTRKPQYQFGWDWSLRMNTIGFNKESSLVAYDNARLVNKTIKVFELFDGGAKVNFEVILQRKVSSESETLVWESTLFGPIQLHGIKADTEGQMRYSADFFIEDAKLWWPQGHGDQYLYNDHIRILDALNEQITEFDFNFGIKTSELVREEDQWGTSYYFKINGKPLFAKGANYIPQDVFPARVEEEEIVKMVETMAASNFNMVRVWGGGYYPDDVFFETCDRLGIMIWQDLMFACAMYPGWEDFVNNVSEELFYQVPRIAAHPSVVQFNGNNEVEVAWGNWGFQIKYGIYGTNAQEVENAYDVIFKQTAQNIVGEYFIPYIHTSPLSNWGKAEFYNHGSQHYWGVWHGKDPIEDFGKKIGRFNAEYGFQSFPEYSTLRTFSTEDQWDITSDVMKHHQKSYVGNDMILKQTKRLYGTPANFKEFVYLGQLTQAMAVSMAVAGHRIDAPRCGGTLFWQLNDCWPVSSWSSIDYYGNWKALQYRIKDDYRPTTIVEKYNDLEHVDYYLIAENESPRSMHIHCEVFDLKGKRVKTIEWDTVAKVNAPVHLVVDLPLKNCDVKNNFHLKFTCQDGAESFTRAFDRVQTREIPEKETVQLEILNIDETNKTATIRIKNNKFVRDLWVHSSKFGVRFDQNFISLLPGEYDIEITFEQTPQLADFDVIFH